MKYETRYTLPSKAENEAKALQDCKEYLGAEFYAKSIRVLRAEMEQAPLRTTADRYRFISFALAMHLGIEGYYPVRAMAREVLK